MGTLVGVCALLGAAACTDVPTGAEPASPAASRATSTPREAGTAEVFCTTSYATPGGPHAYRYGWVRLKLPAAARANDGSTRPYRFRSYVGTTVVQAANCVIPNTELARARVDRLFGVERTRKPKHSGEATLFGDVVGLDPLEVNACQNGNEWPDCEDNPLDNDPTAYELKPCGDSPDCHSGSTGGGGSSDPTTQDPYTPAEDEGTCPQCGEHDPSAKQRESIQQAIDQVQCQSMRTVLQELLPTMQVFTEQPPLYADPNSPLKQLGAHANGVIYIWEGMWQPDGETVRSQSQFVETLVHEAAHAWWTHYQGYFDGQSVHHSKWQETMAECGYPNAE